MESREGSNDDARRQVGVSTQNDGTSARSYADELAQLRRCSKIYRREFLNRELQLSNVRLLSEYPRAQVLAADSGLGPIIVKVYSGSRIPLARLGVCASYALSRRGINVPEILYSELDGTAQEEHGLGCVVSRFVEGRGMKEGDPRDERLIFENLARIHHVEVSEVLDVEIAGVSVDEHSCPLGLAPLPAANDDFVVAGQAAEAALSGIYRFLKPRELRSVVRWCEDARQETLRHVTPNVLLHGDYHRNNVIFGSNSTLFTIDLDSVRTGGFYADLGMALLRTLYRSRSSKLDSLTIGQLLDEDRLRAAEAAYFSVAPYEARRFWEEHRSKLLPAAYLRLLARLVRRAGTTHRGSLPRRLRQRYQILKRWGKVIDYFSATP